MIARPRLAGLVVATLCLAARSAHAQREIVLDVIAGDGRVLFHHEQALPAVERRLTFVANRARYVLTLDRHWETIRLWQGRVQRVSTIVGPSTTTCAMALDVDTRMRLIVHFRAVGMDGPSVCVARWATTRGGAFRVPLGSRGRHPRGTPMNLSGSEGSP